MSAARTVSNGTGDAVGRFLRDIAEPRPARQLDRAFVGIDLADDRLHQRRLAGAVAADQPDAASRRDRGGCAVKDRPPAEADRNSVDGQHVGALAFNREPPKAGFVLAQNRALVSIPKADIGAIVTVKIAGDAVLRISYPESPDDRAAILAETPLGRSGQPDDIGAVTVLASDDSRWLTRERLVASGGMR